MENHIFNFDQVKTFLLNFLTFLHMRNGNDNVKQKNQFYRKEWKALSYCAIKCMRYAYMNGIKGNGKIRLMFRVNVLFT